MLVLRLTGPDPSATSTVHRNIRDCALICAGSHPGLYREYTAIRYSITSSAATSSVGDPSNQRLLPTAISLLSL
jgi:hypothetical protein